MILRLSNILEATKESAAAVGIEENELISLVIVAKFQTEIPNDYLAGALNRLFININTDKAEKIGAIIGVPADGKNLYDFLDAISAYLKAAAADDDDKKVLEIMSFFEMDVNVIHIIRECCGK